MNKEYYNRWGLHLPFRFYNNRTLISEASDYGRRVVIPKTEYLIFPYGEILPFQVTRNPMPEALFSPTMKFICLGTGEELEIALDLSKFVVEKEIDVNPVTGVQRISFMGQIGVDIPKGQYYAKLSGSYGHEWYSENINVLDIDDGTIFRQWTNSNIDLRTVDNNTLRIVT